MIEEQSKITKTANLTYQSITDAEMQKINKFTLTPLKPEDVFIFKAILCDNKVDRDNERLTLKALQTLEKIFVGKTVIKDHRPTSDNQVARIYSTELIQGSEVLECKEPYTQLTASLYMVKTASNADLITEIQGGIKKEGSVSFSVADRICSVCGKSAYHCSHYAGQNYNDGENIKKCVFLLDDIKDAYEFSLVAIPAQKAAGISKNYNKNLDDLISKAKNINIKISKKADKNA